MSENYFDIKYGGAFENTKTFMISVAYSHSSLHALRGVGEG
jgi:hypothetical protein